MKKAFSTLCCLDLSLEQIKELASLTHMDAVELRVDHGSIEAFDRAAKELGNSKLTVCDVASSIFIRGRELDSQCDEYLRLARQLAAPAVRVFAAADYEGVLDVNAIAEGLARLCDMAKNLGLEIWLENHSEFSTVKECRRLCDMASRDNLRILWDVMHSLEYGESLTESLSHLLGKLAHVHLKDGYPEKGKREYTLCALGEGSFPFEDVVDLLEEKRYDGYLSLEWESPWCPHLRGLYENNEELLDRYNDILKKAGIK